jgi:hypothetical protein
MHTETAAPAAKLFALFLSASSKIYVLLLNFYNFPFSYTALQTAPNLLEWRATIGIFSSRSDSWRTTIIHKFTLTQIM